MLKYAEQFLFSLWQLTLEMSPYLMLGFLFAGVLYVWFPRHKVHKYLGQHNFRSVLNASLIGIPLPLCSCGVIPAGISFFKNGASKGASVSFMTSTPQTGVDSILVTWSMLGMPLALIRPIVAMATGVFGGWWVNRGHQKQLSELSKPYVEAPVKDPQNKILAMLKYAFVDFMADIVKWLVIGLVFAAIIDVIVPDDFFSAYMSNSFYEYALVLLASIPLYVCATASVPIAAVLILKGISPGAALVFLMAGPATNAATITVIAQTLGRMTFLKYLVTIIVGAVLSGLIIDYLLPSSWFIITESMQGHQHGILPQWLVWVSTISLLLLIIYHSMRKIKGFFTTSKITTREVNVEEKLSDPTLLVSGMNCKHCKMNIEKHLVQIEGVISVDANENTGAVICRGVDISADDVQKMIHSLGYKLEGVVT